MSTLLLLNHHPDLLHDRSDTFQECQFPRDLSRRHAALHTIGPRPELAQHEVVEAVQ